MGSLTFPLILRNVATDHVSILENPISAAATIASLRYPGSRIDVLQEGAYHVVYADTVIISSSPVSGADAMMRYLQRVFECGVDSYLGPHYVLDTIASLGDYIALIARLDPEHGDVSKLRAILARAITIRGDVDLFSDPNRWS